MPKLNELLERRAAAFQRMKAAQETGGEAFDTAETELRGLDEDIRRIRLVDEAERRESGTPIHGGDASLDRELRNFSLRNALAGAAGIEGVDWGRERELQAELAKRAGRSPQGIFIPAEAFETRVLTKTGGDSLVPTEQRPDLYISALTANMITRAMGATVLSGLRGDVEIPRETGSPNVGWKADNTAFDSSDAAFDQVTLAPKHCGAISEWSRNMLLQTSPEIEQLMRGMLARNIAVAIDKASINGAGGAEPTGIIGTAGVQAQAYATSIMDTAAEMIAKADIGNVNARRSFLTTNGVKKVALKTLDTQSRPLGIPTIFHNEPVSFSNQVPSNLNPTANKHGLIYGDWAELLIGVWSEIDVLVNPYESSAYAKGNVSIRAIATVDTALRHPASFVSATGVAVA